LLAGPLAAFRFIANDVALNTLQRIIYDSGSGNISYDADGSASGAAQVVFAHVNPGTVITNTDFIVI
jgi:Ca2+-binding RTX toxin-like protein